MVPLILGSTGERRTGRCTPGGSRMVGVRRLAVRDPLASCPDVRIEGRVTFLVCLFNVLFHFYPSFFLFVVGIPFSVSFVFPRSVPADRKVFSVVSCPHSCPPPDSPSFSF